MNEAIRRAEFVLDCKKAIEGGYPLIIKEGYPELIGSGVFPGHIVSNVPEGWKELRRIHVGRGIDLEDGAGLTAREFANTIIVGLAYGVVVSDPFCGTIAEYQPA